MTLTHRLLRIACPLGAALAFSLTGTMALGADLKLSGDHEVPPIKTMASGTAAIAIADDGAVGGSVKTTGMTGVAAHIHMGATGKIGPPIITLTKGVDGEWMVPAGAKLTDERM